MGRHSTTPADEHSVDWRSDRVGSAQRGENPMLMAKVPSGYVVFGDSQILPGYCVLLSDVADADHLTDLSSEQRTQFLADMAMLGDAVFAVCGGRDPAFRRLNYEILGNSLHSLHAHVHARYAWEPQEFRSGPVWRYPLEDRNDERHDPLRSPDAEELDELRQAITAELERRLKLG
jgi:diadenosine tetraphosphate (Ap4A) HIT family hydrolase